MRRFGFSILLGSLMLLAFSAVAGADLIPLGGTAGGNAATASGQGFGTLNTILTLQNPASPPTEVGSVYPTGNPVTGFACTGDATCGAPHSQTYTLATVKSFLSGGDASNLVVILNMSQKGSDSTLWLPTGGITLKVYDTTGALQATFACNASCDFSYYPLGGNGQGTSGWAFVLDPTQAATLNSLMTAHPTWILGASGALGGNGTDANDGPDDFALTSRTGVTPGIPVPEPSSMILFGSGLLSVAGIVRRRLLG